MCQSFVFLLTHQLPCVLMLLDWCVPACVHVHVHIRLSVCGWTEQERLSGLPFSWLWIPANSLPSFLWIILSSGPSCLSGFSSQLWTDNILLYLRFDIRSHKVHRYPTPGIHPGCLTFTQHLNSALQFVIIELPGNVATLPSPNLVHTSSDFFAQSAWNF